MLLLLLASGCGARTELACSDRPCARAPAGDGGVEDDDGDVDDGDVDDGDVDDGDGTVPPSLDPDPCTRAIAAGDVDAAPACRGEGLIWTVPDTCLNDGGNAGPDDNIEVYCVEGLARFCLSLEDCPWRDDPLAPGDATCSRGGLGSSAYMANVLPGCVGYLGYQLYCCSGESQVGLSR